MGRIVRSLLLLIGLAVLPACAASERAAGPQVYATTALPPQTQPAPVAAKATPAVRGIVVHFDNDSADIRAAAMQSLYGAAVDLRGTRLTAIRITGFTDGAGHRAHNLKLSERRAAAVADQLRKLGLHAGRIEVKGAGETKGKPRHSKEDRRVEIVFEYEDETVTISAPQPDTTSAASAPTVSSRLILSATPQAQPLRLPQASPTPPGTPAPLRDGGKPAIKQDFVLDGTSWLPPPAA